MAVYRRRRLTVVHYYKGGCEDAYVDKKLARDEPIVLQDIEYLSQVSIYSGNPNCNLVRRDETRKFSLNRER